MIVGMSRRICAELYSAIVKLRPSWHHDDDDKGLIKVVMTGSAADDDESYSRTFATRNAAKRWPSDLKMKRPDEAGDCARYVADRI